MKKGWKLALLAAAAAAVVPYSRKEDPETGAKAIQALLWRYTRIGDSNTLYIGLCLGANRLPTPEETQEEATEADFEELPQEETPEATEEAQGEE